jgi:hypothetical protein
MMNKTQLYFLIFFTGLGFMACNNKGKRPSGSENNSSSASTMNVDPIADTTNYTTIQWLDSVQNFGKVTDGEKVQISFHFKNTGTKPLIITNVSAGCGCTVPVKPEAPIPPGQEGVIKAEFNSEGRVGQASKNVTVTCNTIIQNYTLLFEGEVIAKKQSQ